MGVPSCNFWPYAGGGALLLDLDTWMQKAEAGQTIVTMRVGAKLNTLIKVTAVAVREVDELGVEFDAMSALMTPLNLFGLNSKETGIKPTAFRDMCRSRGWGVCFNTFAVLDAQWVNSMVPREDLERE